MPSRILFDVSEDFRKEYDETLGVFIMRKVFTMVTRHLIDIVKHDPDGVNKVNALILGDAELKIHYKKEVKDV